MTELHKPMKWLELLSRDNGCGNVLNAQYNGLKAIASCGAQVSLKIQLLKITVNIKFANFSGGFTVVGRHHQRQ